jgi:hypothetical protein
LQLREGDETENKPGADLISQPISFKGADEQVERQGEQKYR